MEKIILAINTNYPEPTISTDLDKCSGYGTGVENYPPEILELEQIGSRKRVYPVEHWADLCVACMYCENFSLEVAINLELPGYELRVADAHLGNCQSIQRFLDGRVQNLAFDYAANTIQYIYNCCLLSNRR